MGSITKYNQLIPADKKAWFLVLRFIITTFLIGSGIVFLRPIPFNLSLLSVYGLLALALLAYALATRDSAGTMVRSLIITLIACELLIEGLLVNHVGGNFSPFVIFFIITIVTASLFFHLLGSIVVATLAGLVYALPIFLDLSTLYEGLIAPTRLAGLGISSDEAFYTVFLHLCLFYFSAFISGYLAQNLFWASRELSKIRLETNEILEQMHSGLLTIDCQERVIHFNRAAGEILGVNHLHAKGKLLTEIFHPGLDEFRAKIESVFSSKRSELRDQINIRHPEKGLMPVGLSCSVSASDGELRGIIAVFQDLTDAKRLEAQLRASDRLAAVGRLAAGIAHEIRNPLASISGSVELLKEVLELEGDDRQLLELILKESSRLNTILTDFLNFARVTRGSPGTCDLVPVINEVITLASTHHGAGKRVEISQSLHRPQIAVCGTEDQLKQVLWNLLLNAIQAIDDDGGEILIATENYLEPGKPRMVRLIIADNGRGIPEDIKEKIFEPFFSTKETGTGLGLPLVARIIDCLGGRVEIDSFPKWKTVFSIFLPIDLSSADKLRKTAALTSV